jgi:transcriptional regulator with XRE-family HTH domain
LSAGLSQEELATKARLHRNYTGRIERAEQDIGITALSQIVNALGVSLAEFFAPFRQAQ